jgi:hypothetical protein
VRIRIVDYLAHIHIVDCLKTVFAESSFQRIIFLYSPMDVLFIVNVRAEE